MTSVRRVAVVRLDALGDTLLSTPAIEVLCREYGPENVLILTSPGLGSIFGDEPVHCEIPMDAGEEKIAQAIDEFGAQTVYTFSEKRRALRGSYLSSAKERVGFDPGWTQPLRSLEVRRYLTVRFSIVNSLDSSSRYHEVERYCRLVAKGLSKKSINGGRLRFFGLDRPEISSRLAGPVGFQWASKWLQGNWPEELLLALVESLPTTARIFVPPSEEERARELLDPTRAENLVCCQSLKDYATALADCQHLLSIDTGAVHVAAAMGVPVVDVFPEEGAHHTVPRWRPWMTPHRVILKPKYSRPEDVTELVAAVSKAQCELGEILGTLAPH